MTLCCMLQFFFLVKCFRASLSSSTAQPLTACLHPAPPRCAQQLPRCAWHIAGLH